jgi:pimeloyl-ACP methyl ester carboxylesterase
MSSRKYIAIALVALWMAAGGCATRPANRSFDVSATDARRALREMRNWPRPLERPVVVLDGLGPPMASWLLAGELKRVLGDDSVLGVTFAFSDTFDNCRSHLVRAVEKHFPSDDPLLTAEVDVVAVSMGGVVARYAATPPGGTPGKRLKVARLFTISSPHRGAQLAALPALLGRKQIDMREGSPFLRDLARRERESADYEIVPYARLGDGVVGEHNAAPAGRTPRWLPNLPLEPAHLACFTDPRIVADIVRRLRGEPPFSTDPPEPLPQG